MNGTSIEKRLVIPRSTTLPLGWPKTYPYQQVESAQWWVWWRCQSFFYTHQGNKVTFDIALRIGSDEHFINIPMLCIIRTRVESLDVQVAVCLMRRTLSRGGFVCDKTSTRLQRTRSLLDTGLIHWKYMGTYSMYQHAWFSRLLVALFETLKERCWSLQSTGSTGLEYRITVNKR